MNYEGELYEDDSVSVIEEEAEFVEYSDDAGVNDESLLTRAGRYLFLVFLLVFPLLFLPTSISPVELNKTYFGAITLILSLMLTLGGALQEGRMRFVSSRLYIVFAFFAISVLAASLFSVSPIDSLWGFGTESFTFAHVVLAGIGFFLVPLTIRTRDHLTKALTMIGFSLMVSVLFFYLRSVFNINFLPWQFAENRGFHPFGSWNSAAIFFGFGTALLLPLIQLSHSRKAIYSGLLFLLLVLSVLLSNFPQVWILLGVISLFYVSLSLSQRDQKSHLFAISLFLLLASVLFILLSGVLGQFFADQFNGFGRPNEIVLSSGATYDIARQALSESPLVGTGPNTFGYAWDKFKNPDINRSPFWQVRFNSGSSMFLTLVPESGIFGAVAFLSFIALFLWIGVRALGSAGNQKSIFVRSTFAGSLFLLLSWFIYPLNLALVLLTFISVGLFIAALGESRLSRTFVLPFFETKERGFVFSLIVIFLLIGGIGAVYLESTRYLAALSFGRGIAVFNEEGAVNTSAEIIERATALDANQDRYYRTLAELRLLNIRRVFSNQELTQDDRSELLRFSYSRALESINQAIRVGGEDARNYRLRGQIYEAVIPVDPNVSDLALESYEKARELSPQDPSLVLDLARTHLSFADVTLIRGGGTSSQRIADESRVKAIGFLEEAVRLKPDYAQAHFTLARLYGVRNQINEAIRSAEQTVELAPNDIGVLFQLGLLYYRQDNFQESRRVLERAVSINQNYSNAKYFLGLIYDREGDREKALAQFVEIRELNPSNREVERIIKALEEGRTAESALSEPPPEERPRAPLDEEATSENSPSQ